MCDQTDSVARSTRLAPFGERDHEIQVLDPSAGALAIRRNGSLGGPNRSRTFSQIAVDQRKRHAVPLETDKARARRWRSNVDGVAAVEFALIAPLLLILVTGVAEIGIAAYQAMQVQAAAEAGALYAAKNGASNLTAIGTAVVNGTGTFGITAVPAPTTFCGCPTATGVVSQNADCSTVCASDSKAPGHYVLVNARITHTTWLPYLNLALPATLTASSTVRVQ